MKLITIPFAGGNRYSLLRLRSLLSKEVEYHALELPGRGDRMSQPLLTSLELMIADLRQQIEPHLRSEYILYGHSMGAALGNLLLHHLYKKGSKLPVHFLVTGRSAPRYQNMDRNLHLLRDDEFVAELHRMGGLPEEVLAHKEILQYFLPIIRTDIQALETSRYQESGAYPVPITAIAGMEEAITEQQLQGWVEETSVAFRSLRLPGNHFFIFDHLDRLAKLINQAALEAKIVYQ